MSNGVGQPHCHGTGLGAEGFLRGILRARYQLSLEPLYEIFQRALSEQFVP